MVKSTLTLDLLPGEEPERPALEDWLDNQSSTLRRIGFGPAMRGEWPRALWQLHSAMNVADMPALDAEQRAAAGPLEATKHDMLVAKAARDKEAAAQQFRAGLREHNNQLAAMLETALRPHASLRLQELLAKHEYSSTPGCYDGGAMWRDLVELRKTKSRLQDNRVHDRQGDRGDEG